MAGMTSLFTLVDALKIDVVLWHTVDGFSVKHFAINKCMKVFLVGDKLNRFSLIFVCSCAVPAKLVSSYITRPYCCHIHISIWDYSQLPAVN